MFEGQINGTLRTAKRLQEKRIPSSQAIAHDQFVKTRVVLDRIPFPAMFQIVDCDAVIDTLQAYRFNSEKNVFRLMDSSADSVL